MVKWREELESIGTRPDEVFRSNGPHELPQTRHWRHILRLLPRATVQSRSPTCVRHQFNGERLTFKHRSKSGHVRSREQIFRRFSMMA